MKWQRICFVLASAAALIFSAASSRADRPTSAPADIRETPRCVALTFDDGPRADTTPLLLDGLRQRGVHATFFLIGNQIAPNAALVRRMHAEGHQVGNHTWSHRRLQGASQAVVQAEVGRTDAMLRAVLGNGTYWVRPPYGLLSESQQRLFSVPLVRWSVDPKDWKRRNADADTAAVLRCVKPGDIILMHDAYRPSVTAALRIVDALRSQGYHFSTVEELLKAQGTSPQPGCVYCSASAH